MAWKPNHNTRSVPHALQQACFRRDNWVCQGCGYVGRQRRGDLHADHIHNRARGGTDTLENLQTLCDDRCHRAKTQAEAREGKRRHLRKPRPHPADRL